MRINFWYSNGISDTSGSFVVIDKVITTAPVIRKPATENYEVLFGTSDGEIIIYDLESLITQNPVRKNSLVIEPGAQVKKLPHLIQKYLLLQLRLLTIPNMI